MRHHTTRAVAVLAAVLAIAFGVVTVAPTAAAVGPYVGLGYYTDTTYIDDMSGAAGAVRIGLEWEARDNGIVRVKAFPAGHHSGITWTNNSDASLRCIGAGSGSVNGGQVQYARHRNPVTGQDQNLGANRNDFTVPAHSTRYMPVSGTTFWTGTSPNTGIGSGEDPYLGINCLVIGPGGWTGGFLTTEINNTYA